MAAFFGTLCFCACQSTPTETKPTATTAPTPVATATQPAKESEHEHSAPHGGALIELGEEFAHLELVLEAASGKLTAYALDGEAEKAVRLKQADIEITLFNPAGTVKLLGVANSLTGETAQDTSEFSGVAETLKGTSAFAGVIRALSIKGQSFKEINFSYPQGSEKK